jgi:inward rectifier potassium channel
MHTVNKPPAGIDLDGSARERIGRVTSGEAAPTLFSDLYFYLISASWMRLLLMVIALFVIINCLFAAGYMIDGGIANARRSSFADNFFFSVQTMATIGYGIMAPRSFISNVLVSIEALSGLIALALVTGLVFARFSRPTARVRFSKVAIVAPRNGVPSLMFRVVNQRNNRIVEAQIHVVYSRWERTSEGESMRRFYDLHLERSRNALFSLSWTVMHPIDRNSPLFGQSAESLKESRSLIIASLVGLDESFLQNVHVRYVWTANEIAWGMRFVDVLQELPDGSFSIDYSHFDEVVPAPDASPDTAAAEAFTGKPDSRRSMRGSI